MWISALSTLALSTMDKPTQIGGAVSSKMSGSSAWVSDDAIGLFVFPKALALPDHAHIIFDGALKDAITRTQACPGGPGQHRLLQLLDALL